MNKQFHSHSYPGAQDVELIGYREVDLDAGPFQRPEISIFPAENSEHVEIDSCTGLPKLPVEPPAPPSPEALRSTTKVSSLLSSVLKMANSPSKRKSVTFDPSAGDENERASSGPGHTPLKKSSESAVTLREAVAKQSKRPNGRPTSLPNRTRSVFIKLIQPPRTPGSSAGRNRRIHAGHSQQESYPSELDSMPDSRLTEGMPEGLKILDDEAGSSSPIFSRWNSGRRSSFLYQQGEKSEDDGHFLGSGDDFVTPFAQVLSTLHRVRSEFLQLMGLPTDTRTLYTRPAWTPAYSPINPRKVSGVPEGKEAMEVLRELDWSLKMLETVNANQSMGSVTGDKIKRLLSRELSHLSEGSENGAQVAEWVTDITKSDPYTMSSLLGSSVNPDDPKFESSLSASMSHDNWVRHRSVPAPGRRITVEAESVPKFGVECANKNMEEMNKYMDSKLYIWNVDVFHFDSLSGGNPLVSACYMLFKKHNFFTELQISPHIFINFMTTIQDSYHSVNPYHNAMHATDVLLITNQLLAAESLTGVFSQVEVMAALVAAAVHDVEHPGVTNLYLISIRHELAIMYNDSSVLENHHVATAFRALQKPKCNFLERLDMDCVQLFRRAVIDMVLSTDMAKHIENVAEMKTLIETKKLTNDGLLSLGSYKENSAVLKCLIHCADLSNPTKSPSLAADWSYRIMEENFKQGDREKELGITIHAMGDREGVSIPKCQVSFIDFIVYPLWETWAELVYPDAQHVLDNIATTKAYWCKLAENEEETPHGGGADEVSPPESPKPSPPKASSSKTWPPESSKTLPPESSKASAPRSSKTWPPESPREGGVESSSDRMHQEAFNSSPANERRTSYRSTKAKAIVHSSASASQSLQDS